MNNRKIKYLVLFLFFLSIPLVLFSQKMQGVVIEKDSRLPVPFATVIYKINETQKGIITDVQGRFELTDLRISAIEVSSLGYKAQKKTVDWQSVRQNLVVELIRTDLNLNEVVVTPGNNPAIRIIRGVLKNKDKNNFEKYDFYRYRCYHKTIYDMKFPKDSAGNSIVDTTVFKTMSKTALLISETVTEVGQSGGIKNEEIMASKTSGFPNSYLLGQLNYMAFSNVMSFYNNSVSLFKEAGNEGKIETNYVSPLSDNCLSGYNYQLEEIYVQGNDTVFEISYFPKKGKRFNTLSGKMFIESSGFALVDITAEPSEKTLIEFKFRQQYTLQSGKWFPSKLEEEISFNGLSRDKSVPVFIVTSTIDSISYDKTVAKKQNQSYVERIKVNEDALKNSMDVIALVRPDTLTIRELETYKTIDSIGEKYPFEKVLDYVIGTTPKLAESKIEIPYIDIDLSKIIKYNEYEGYRIGMGVYTNDDIIKNFSFGGYVGYGFRDKTLKYGGGFEWTISRKSDLKLKYSYVNDLFEVGSDFSGILRNNSLNAYLRSFQSYRFEKNEGHKAEVEIRPLRYFKTGIALSLNNLNPTYEYKYMGNELKNYKADELQFSLTYAHGEEFSTIRNSKIVYKAGNPIINFVYKRGFSGLREQSWEYNKLEANIDVNAYNGRLGESKIRLSGGYIDRSLPYGLLFTGEGSAPDVFTSFVIGNTFQTMQPYEFLSDRYVNLFFTHNFGALLFGIGKFKPEFVFMQNSGWGNLSNGSYHSIEFRTKDKFYHESGLLVSNLLKLNYLNTFYLQLGAGVFYRYGNYANNAVKDNLVFKIDFSFSYK